MSTEVSKYNVLDERGLDTLLQAIFQIVEENYVRRSTLEELEKQIKELQDKFAAANPTYTVDDFKTSIGEDGTLTVSIPDGVEVNLNINDAGELILHSNDTAIDKIIAKFHFEVKEDGNLYVSHEE